MVRPWWWVNLSVWYKVDWNVRKLISRFNSFKLTIVYHVKLSLSVPVNDWSCLAANKCGDNSSFFGSLWRYETTNLAYFLNFVNLAFWHFRVHCSTWNCSNFVHFYEKFINSIRLKKWFFISNKVVQNRKSSFISW